MVVELVWIALAIGGIGYSLLESFKERKNGIGLIKYAMKKKKHLVLVEYPNSFGLSVIENVSDNIAFCNNKETLIAPPGTLKPCTNLGNVMIGHGDIYFSSLIPTETKTLIENLRKEGLTEDEIAQLFDLNASTKDELEVKLNELEKDQNVKIENKEKIVDSYGRIIGRLRRFDDVKNFINTGLNRVLLKRTLLTLVEQNKLNQMFGQKNWINIAIAAGIILVILAAVVMMLSNTGLLSGIGVQSSGNTITSVIRPDTIG